MSRSAGGTSFTTRCPSVSVPEVIVSSPATMRKVVLLPQPEGPTSTTNSPASTRRSTPCTATTPLSYSLRTRSSCTGAALLARTGSRSLIILSRMNDSLLFLKSFWCGASTSAYQIEGSPLADGAGPSIWQRFTHTPGLTHNGDTGDIACDHYRRYPGDVALMQSLGIQAYRFSISWSRVLPAGKGAVNAAGLDFYDRLVDALVAAG